MPTTRPDDEMEPVDNLNDLIRAREERRSALSDDVDGMEDVQSTDVDVDDALTFPHPKQNHEETTPSVELMDTPREEDVGFDYDDSEAEMLPSEYTEPYSEMTTTHLTDDEEELAEEQVGELGEVSADDFADGSIEIETPEQGGPRGAEVEETGTQS
jgi:hypothetical protein